METLSIVLNSRSPYLLDRFLHSFEVKSTRYDFQIIVGIDSDDYESQEYAAQYKSPLKVIFDVDSRTHALNHRLNSMVNRYPAHLYWGMNDDVEIRTYEWHDKLILEDTPRMYYMDDDLSFSTDSFCCFPMMNHHLKSKFGFFIPPEYENPAADHVLYEIVSVRPDLISLLDIKLWHYKYGRHPKWFTHSLERPKINYEIKIGKTRLDHYKSIVQAC